MSAKRYKNQEPILRENLLRCARAWVAANNSTMDYASRKFHGDGPFFSRLMRGEGSFTMRKYDDVLKAFRKNMGAGAMPQLRNTNHPKPHRLKKGANHG